MGLRGPDGPEDVDGVRCKSLQVFGEIDAFLSRLGDVRHRKSP